MLKAVAVAAAQHTTHIDKQDCLFISIIRLKNIKTKSQTHTAPYP